MRNGVWHQLGDRGQKIAEEQLREGNGVGVVLSPRDLSADNAKAYSESYRSLGAEVLFDPQFYIPENRSGQQGTYEELNEFRVSASKLVDNSHVEMRKLETALKVMAQRYACTGIVAPAVALEAGRPDSLQVNLALLMAAKSAAQAMSLPVFGVIPVGKSLLNSDLELATTIARMTAKRVDGWIFMADSGLDGYCLDKDCVKAIATSLLRLAQTGKPVMHGCAGPLSILSICFGATAVGLAHSKNMWRLPLSRFLPPEVSGGGGAAPPRVFSRSLWSSFVFPEELQPLPKQLRERIVTNSKWVFIDPQDDNYFVAQVSKWDTNKHLLYMIGSTIAELQSLGSSRKIAVQVQGILRNASTLHGEVERVIAVKDNANQHTSCWQQALDEILETRVSDYQYLDLVSDIASS